MEDKHAPLSTNTSEAEPAPFADAEMDAVVGGSDIATNNGTSLTISLDTNKLTTSTSGAAFKPALRG